MIRTYGLNSNRHDTFHNTVIQQDGSTHYPNAFADIGDLGPVAVQYIHWRSTQDFCIREILCYEKKRLYASDFLVSPSYIQVANSAIDFTSCTTESAPTTFEFAFGRVTWRVITL